jgi:predicted transcriptional regulator of viral defense system
MSVRVIVEIEDWTHGQGGMVTTSQAAASGVSRRVLHSLTGAGALARRRHGVYQLTMVPSSRNDDVRAAWLQAEPGPLRPDQRSAAVCRETAAEVYGIGDLYPPAIQLTLPRPRRTNQLDVRFYAAELGADEVEWVDGIRVTRPARIIDDLLADGYGDLEHLGALAVDAVKDGTLAPAELFRACSAHAQQFGFPTGDGEGLARLMWEGVTSDELAVAA